VASRSRSQNQVPATIRNIGFAMLIASPSVYSVRKRYAHWRASFMESRSTFWLRVDQGASIITTGGIALLELASELSRLDAQHPRAERALEPPTVGDGIDLTREHPPVDGVAQIRAQEKR
jgi:hypothetical protein